jgi:hypothetical protein
VPHAPPRTDRMCQPVPLWRDETNPVRKAAHRHPWRCIRSCALGGLEAAGAARLCILQRPGGHSSPHAQGGPRGEGCSALGGTRPGLAYKGTTNRPRPPRERASRRGGGEHPYRKGSRGPVQWFSKDCAIWPKRFAAPGTKNSREACQNR